VLISKIIHSSNIRLVLFLFSLFVLLQLTIPTILHAKPNTENIEYIISDALKANLSEKPEWLSLLHYKENTFTNSYYSEIDGVQFFNAQNGNIHPRAELIATIKAMHSTFISEINRHPQCLFPARLAWLKYTLPSFNEELPKIKCTRFLEWRHFLNAESISLVFISPSVDNSGSIFGNTFLKINPPKMRKDVFNKGRNLLPAKAISFAVNATTEQQDEWFYSINAALGKYPGKITIESYVNRIARYDDSEDRDIWEYELNLTPFETEQLLDHVWELKQTKINYYYFDENSAYMLLSLIDAVKSKLNLTDSFSLQVIPVDTIRELIDKEVISDIKYIPSTLTNIKYHYEEYSSSQQDIISGLIDGSKTTNDPEFKKLVSTLQIFLIEIANQYLQLSFKRGEIDRISYKVRSLRLRKARKKLDPLIQLANAPPPTTRPDQGHKTSRLDIGVGRNASESFVEVNWRPALHDLLDSDGTYNAGTQINYLDTIVRLDDKHGLAQFERLHFINLYSLHPRSALFKPWSFKFKTGLDREAIFTPDRNLYFNVNGGVGFTYQLAKPLRVYGMLEATMAIDKHFENTVSFAAGPNVGALWQITKNWKLWFDSSTQYYDSQNTNNIVVKHSLGQSYSIYKNRVIRLSITKQGLQKLTTQETKISLSWYY